jgi:hypothetical protein
MPIGIKKFKCRHFDDFSWGETRKVEGEKHSGGGHVDDQNAYEQTLIPYMKWREWELERRMQLQPETMPNNFPIAGGNSRNDPRAF